MRRQDRLLAEAEARDWITRAYCGRVGTVNADGWPYVVRLLHVFSGDVISMHNTAVRGHFRLNVERDTPQRDCLRAHPDHRRARRESGLLR
jgi:nitroimidazol reductase NimA-like FMN-containing flavoprotein (pyridoxamine 5'-phosphate oxidase superfamily)